MGITSSLFFSSNDSDKQTLHRRITPTDDQFAEQQERWNALAEYLVTDLKLKSGLAIRTWLQGSYKFGTQVRPARLAGEFDIDLGIYFEWSGQPHEGHYRAENIKRLVQESLKSYSGDEVIEVVAPPKPRCARIRFKWDFHIDVPAYHLDPERDARALATEENGWESSDSKTLYLWFKNEFEDDYTRSKARRQIRYLKAWAALKFHEESGRPSSTLLTVLVSEAYRDVLQNGTASDDEALCAVVERMLDRLESEPKVANPVDDQETLTARLSGPQLAVFVNQLRDLHGTAQAALGSASLVDAADKWSEAFEHFFPMPDDQELAKSINEMAQLPMVIKPEIDVRAISKDNRAFDWRGLNRIGPIPKNCDIYFRLINQNIVPPGATIEWIVRNEGEEAETINDLGHTAGSGITAQERSAYKGTHFMDCAIKAYGRVIGFRRVPVNITGMFIPRRNPGRRSNVRIGGRR